MTMTMTTTATELRAMDAGAEPIRIGRAVLTTDHPASSRGIPVLIVDGVAYGPEDAMGRNLAGSVMATCDAVHSETGLTNEQQNALFAWFAQSPAHGGRWIAEVKRAARTEVSEYPDE